MNFEVYARVLTQVLVVVGMSGGVDSSVSALLLAKNVCQKVQHIQNLFKTNVNC
jgi:tRNA U34 2-thiouridine synthase MnmA/TrmU